ncbi:MAG: type III polyketide synthase [Isosphaeraceae bacterium]|nr:type III polyketide synthase [Isosphaeraceae bacterium]
MSMRIVGIGTAVPRHRITQDDAAQITEPFACETSAQRRRFLATYRLSGVETRHSVVLEASEGDLDSRQSFFAANHPRTSDRMRLYEQEAGALAESAARDALTESALPPARVTHLVTVSCTGFHAPGLDCALIQDLGLSRGVARTHVGFMGCHGLLNGLRVAHAFLGADPAACVLVCAVELCSLHHQYGWDPEKIVANALFADGAGAVVGVGGTSRTASDAYRVVASGSTLVDDSQDAMGWRVGDHGFEMMLSPRVPDLIGQHVRPWLDGWLGQHGLTIESVGSWAVHPGGPRILSAFGAATGIDRAALAPSVQVLADYGNMSSPTVLFILDRLRRAGAARPCVAIGFGPGLAIEAALLA